MKPAPFEYHAPRSLDEALTLLDRYGGEARPLAGGQSLVPAMNFRLAQPAVLVDLNRVDGLAGITVGVEGNLCVGAMTRQRVLERDPVVAERAPLLAEATPHIAHPPIRNRGTVGGSLAHADPASELPAVMVALDARFHLARRGGERWIPAKDFFLGLFATALEPGELLLEVELPPPEPRTGFAFEEVARRHGDYALAGAAATVSLAPDGRCAGARVVLLGVGEGPVTAAATGALLGEKPEDAALATVADAAGRELDPPADLHASSAFRRQLATVVIRRALSRAAVRARRP